MFVCETSAAAFLLTRFRGLARVPGVAHPWSTARRWTRLPESTAPEVEILTTRAASLIAVVTITTQHQVSTTTFQTQITRKAVARSSQAIMGRRCFLPLNLSSACEANALLK